jgi:hypothetical protein
VNVDFLIDHIKWIFSGVGVAVVGGLIAWIRHKKHHLPPAGSQVQHASGKSTAYQAGRDLTVNSILPTPTPSAIVRAHRAVFTDDPNRPLYFIRVVNTTPGTDIVITHVWYRGSMRIDVINPRTRLPKRLQPSEPWDTWIAVSEVPQDADALNNFQIKLSTGDEFRSQDNRDIPPRGFVSPEA